VFAVNPSPLSLERIWAPAGRARRGGVRAATVPLPARPEASAPPSRRWRIAGERCRRAA
jgi:hypothetical protein